MSAPPKIYIAGHEGMVGSSILRMLQAEGFDNFVLRTSAELDLTKQEDVKHFFKRNKPDQVYLAAAKVGGIHANNTYPAEFIYQNLMIQSNLIHQSYLSGVKQLLFLGSSCIYPKMAPQPMKENALLSGKLEPTNEPYAIAKIAGIKMCESYNRQYGVDYRSVMPTNLYGPGDNYHEKNSHVIPALIRRFHEAKINNAEKVVVWGSGSPRREFLYVDDMARACIYVMNLDSCSHKEHTDMMQGHINVGFGDDISIKQLADLIAKVVGFKGKVGLDANQLDGAPRKFMSSEKIQSLGWQPLFDLEQGLVKTYQDFNENYKFLRNK